MTHHLPGSGPLSRRGFIACAASIVLPSRSTDIGHSLPSGMFPGGPRRTGFCDADDVAADATLEPFFKAKGKLVASPLLVEDLVCIGGCSVRNIVLERKKPHTFHAIDVRTGKERWSFKAEKSLVASAAYYDDTVLVGDLDGKVHAHDLDGRRRWVFQAEGGIFGSPAVYGHHVVFAAGDMGGARLYCLDIRERRLRWPPVEMAAGPFASPCIAGGNVFIGTYWNLKKHCYYYVVDILTGEVRKTLDLPEVCFCSTAASDGRTVYIADCGEWHRPSRFYAWDARTAEEMWRLDVDAENIASSLSLVGDLAIFGCDKGYLYAVNVKTQQLEWKSSHKAGAYHGSPCATRGHIYIGSKRGRLHVFDHAGQHLREHKAKRAIESTPAIRDRRLFIGCNDGVLYRLA